MNRALAVEAEAEAEIDQAANWYLEHSPRAAAGFRAAVDSAMDVIRRNPEQYQIIYRQTRRVLLDGYPYALFYAATASKVTVVSCFHSARDPKLWR